jgi:hypothetical protein
MILFKSILFKYESLLSFQGMRENMSEWKGDYLMPCSIQQKVRAFHQDLDAVYNFQLILSEKSD